MDKDDTIFIQSTFTKFVSVAGECEWCANYLRTPFGNIQNSFIAKNHD